MKKYSIALEDLSKSRWFVLIGSALTLFSVFMPWHTVGTAALNTVLSFNGFQDQNMIIGVITFVFSFVSFLSCFLLFRFTRVINRPATGTSILP